MAKAKDTTPKFEANKNYAIGTLQSNASPSEIPERFAKVPVPVMRLCGADLLHNDIKTCRAFLLSPVCKFKQGSSVYFYEVDVKDGEEGFKLIYTGMPLVSATPSSTLSDAPQEAKDNGVVLQNIIPTHASEAEKMLWSSQKEQVATKAPSPARKRPMNQRDVELYGYETGDAFKNIKKNTNKQLGKTLLLGACGAIMYPLVPTIAQAISNKDFSGYGGLVLGVGTATLIGLATGNPAIAVGAISAGGTHLLYSKGTGAVENMLNTPIFRMNPVVAVQTITNEEEKITINK